MIEYKNLSVYNTV